MGFFKKACLFYFLQGKIAFFLQNNEKRKGVFQAFPFKSKRLKIVNKISILRHARSNIPGIHKARFLIEGYSRCIFPVHAQFHNRITVTGAVAPDHFLYRL